MQPVDSEPMWQRKKYGSEQSWYTFQWEGSTDASMKQNGKNIFIFQHFCDIISYLMEVMICTTFLSLQDTAQSFTILSMKSEEGGLF